MHVHVYYECEICLNVLTILINLLLLLPTFYLLNVSDKIEICNNDIPVDVFI